MSEQLDRIEKKVDQITMVLGGNEELKQKGLMEDYRETKTMAYKTKADVSKLKWIASGIASVISAVWAAIVTWYNS